jgi:hypothetical protein
MALDSAGEGASAPRSTTRRRVLTPKQRLVGAERNADPVSAEQTVMRRAHYSEWSARKPAEVLGPGGSHALAAQLRAETPQTEPSSARELEAMTRGAIAERVRGGKASDGLLVGSWKVAAEVLAGQPEPPPGATAADYDYVQELINLAALTTCRRVWERERPGLPVPPVLEEDYAAIKIKELCEQLVLEDAPEVPVDGKDNIVDVELVDEPIDEEDPTL